MEHLTSDWCAGAGGPGRCGGARGQVEGPTAGRPESDRTHGGADSRAGSGSASRSLSHWVCERGEAGGDKDACDCQLVLGGAAACTGLVGARLRPVTRVSERLAPPPTPLPFWPTSAGCACVGAISCAGAPRHCAAAASCAAMAAPLGGAPGGVGRRASAEAAPGAWRRPARCRCVGLRAPAQAGSCGPTVAMGRAAGSALARPAPLPCARAPAMCSPVRCTLERIVGEPREKGLPAC